MTPQIVSKFVSFTHDTNLVQPPVCWTFIHEQKLSSVPGGKLSVNSLGSCVKLGPTLCWCPSFCLTLKASAFSGVQLTNCTVERKINIIFCVHSWFQRCRSAKACDGRAVERNDGSWTFTHFILLTADFVAKIAHIQFHALAKHQIFAKNLIKHLRW